MGFDQVDALFQAVNFCLHPVTSEFASTELHIDEDILRLAATHIGVTEISDLFQRHVEQDAQKLHLFALYFAGAQAKILGFQTSTILLAMDLNDETYLRLNNIALVTEQGDETDLNKAYGSLILEGAKVSQIKNIAGRKGFTA